MIRAVATRAPEVAPNPVFRRGEPIEERGVLEGERLCGLWAYIWPGVREAEEGSNLLKYK